MTDTGLDFKAPPNSDKEAWQILQILAENRFRFDGCGCFVGYSPPRTLNEVPAWLEAHRSKSEGEKLLETFEERSSG